MVDDIEATINELLLDEENPRIGSVGSQSEALEELIQLNDAHFRNLMLSIKEHSLDPGDSFYVIESTEESDYVVLDGNRRLAALKVLNNPSFLVDLELPTNITRSLTRAAVGFSAEAVEPIRCVVFESREAANDWIYRRHTGQQEGEGRITWGTLEIQRFTGERSTLDILDFVGRNADFSHEEWASTKASIESRKSSNLTRILESKPGREFLGIGMEGPDGTRRPVLAKDPEWALKVLTRIIEDVRDGQAYSRNTNTAKDIKKYLDSFPDELKPTAASDTAPQAFRDINIKHPKRDPPAKPKRKPKEKPAPRSRKTLAEKRHVFEPPKMTKGQQLLREASGLDADRFRISAAFVLRAFIELAVAEYMKANSLPTHETDGSGKQSPLDLAVRVDRVIADIVRQKTFTNAELQPFRNLVMAKTEHLHPVAKRLHP